MINKLHLAMIELYRGDAKRIQHFCKVHSYAKLIAETENVDKECLFIIEAAALTHDIGIHSCEEKYGNCNGKLQEKEGPAIAEKMLKELGFDQDVSDRVQYLIRQDTDKVTDQFLMMLACRRAGNKESLGIQGNNFTILICYHTDI